MTFFSPFETIHTALLDVSSAYVSGVNTVEMRTYTAVHKLNTSYTGFSLLASSGNITGKIIVYGLAE
jgi:hypothetical protein